jgi:hypothetical protein
MRPILPFMAALILFGSLAGCGGSSSGSGSSASGSSASAAPTGAALDKVACRAVESYPAFTTSSQGLAFAGFLAKEAGKGTLSPKLASDMTSLSTILKGNESGNAADTKLKVEGDATTLHTDCQQYLPS